MTHCFGTDLRFPSLLLFIFVHAPKRIIPRPLLLLDYSLGSLILVLAVAALPQTSNMESLPDGIVITMIFLLGLFAIYFGKCVKGPLADRIEEVLHIRRRVFMNYYKFALLVKHLRCDK